MKNIQTNMNFGEMFAWTSRLINILEVGGLLKKIRLQALLTDLETATDVENDYFARCLYLRVQEEVNSYGGAI